MERACVEAVMKSQQPDHTPSARTGLKHDAFDERHYRSLVTSIDHGLCTVEVIFGEGGRGIDCRFLDVNPAFERQTGLHGAVGRTMRQLVPLDDDDYFYLYGEVARTQTPVRFERNASSLGRVFDVYAFPVDDPSLHRIAVLFSDITSIRQAEKDLQASEARYRALAESTTNAIFRLDAEGTHVLEVYGGNVPPHGRSDAPSASWLETEVHPDDRERMGRAWLDTVARGLTFEAEARARRADGTWGWMLVRTVPIRNDVGEVVEWIGSATDITRRRDNEDALRRSEADHSVARQEAERANATKDDFLAMLGHELRNPLAPILTALQLMRLRGQGSREQDVLERQVKHLTRMVDDLLDVSRITHGKVELKRRPIELSDVVNRAMELAGPIFEQRRDVVDVQVPQTGLGIDVDRGRMAQVISNLLTNAAKYSEPGSRIILLGERADGVVRLSVTDEGVGIARGMLGAVFNAFVQQPQSLDRAGGGLGLGLAIVRTLVTAHGGTVWAESPGPGKGSTFVVELPAVAVTEAVEEQAPVRPARPAVASGQRVLVVDDNEDAANVLRAALEELGYTVDVALDGPSALDRARLFGPRTVLMDIGLPMMNGYEVARRLRALEKTSRMRLIAITGYGQDADRHRAYQAGFDEHLMKPIDLDVLERVIENHAD